MFVKSIITESEYTRISKLGQAHTYKRKKTLAIFLCDNCGKEFNRDLKHVDRKRLSDNYFHCCADCDTKRFAQRKGVQRKKIGDMPASLDLPVSKF